MTATTFVNGINPWTQAKQPTRTTKMPKKPTTSTRRVDPATLEIADDPLPSVRLITNKYWPIFGKMKVGQNIRCRPDEVQPVANALRKFVEMHKIAHKGNPARVISQYNAPDGIGRVWLAEGEAPSKKKAA